PPTLSVALTAGYGLRAIMLSHTIRGISRQTAEDAATPPNYSLDQRYRSATVGSRRMMERAKRVMPGGNTRTGTDFFPYPLVIARAEGPFLWDVDGNRYIDLLYNYTSLVHGHAYPPIIEAARRAIGASTAWPAASVSQIELAETLQERVPSIERLRFCNSGTEAAMLAAVAARTVTGRSLLVKATTGYHGSYDAFRPQSDGTPLTLTCRYNDLRSLEDVMRDNGRDVAAVFLEPVLG